MIYRASLPGLCLEIGIYYIYSDCVLLQSWGMQVVCYAADKEKILSALKLTWCIMGTLQLVNSHDAVMQVIVY